ncbi:MAG: lactonase family protein [Gammaproteobacteria bacterium]|nr:MAG: lactonase family protein [Gammaproteobacteria bacterium]
MLQRKLFLSLTLILGITTTASSLAETVKVVASGYTDTGGEGVYGLTFDTATNKFGPIQLLTKTNNPSFGLHNKNVWYFVDEDKEGQLLSFSQNEKGELNLLQKSSVSGKWPCYISVRKDGKYVAVANYGSGNIAVFELDEKGVPKGKPQLKQHEGKGPNAERQESAHAHWAGWSQLNDANKTTGIYAIDLGVDKIFWYPQDSKGTLAEGQVAYKAAPGDGPRHLAIHPQKPWVYVLNELGNTLSVTQQDTKGHLTEIQKVSALPADFKGKSTAAHIVISADGKHLYTSNRGDLNSISVFNIADDGKVTLAQNISSQGKLPRFFLLLEDAKKMLVANQDSNNLVVLNILANGQLEYSGAQTQIPKPTFLGLQ